MAWVRLTMHEDDGDGFTCADYWETKVMYTDCM